MDSNKIKDILVSNIPDLEIYLDKALNTYTTVKIGGPANILINSKNSYQLKSIVQLLYQNNIEKPLILGFGSNSLISDKGVNRVVIKNSSDFIDFDKTISDSTLSYNKTSVSTTNRSEIDPQKYLDFSSLNYSEDQYPHQLITLDSGVSLPFAINKLIDQGFTGLQWFSYIPSSIGGAVYSNIHGGTHNFSEYVKSIEVFDYSTGLTKTLKSDDLKWSYDFSSFQQNPNLIILSVTLSLPLGDTALAKEVVKKWISQKQKVQPFNSLGSVFKNPSLETCLPIFGEQKSSGWIIEHGLELKGHKIGQVQISPLHANFIVNNGNALASDYLSLIRLVQSKAKEKYNLDLETEINIIGQF